jgi:hypothetical protein
VSVPDREQLIRALLDELDWTSGSNSTGTLSEILQALDRLGFSIIPTGDAAEAQPNPVPRDQFGVIWPDGAWYSCAEAARLFGQDEEERARLIAGKNGGRAVRIVTRLVDLDAPGAASERTNPQ